MAEKQPLQRDASLNLDPQKEKTREGYVPVRTAGEEATTGQTGGGDEEIPQEWLRGGVRNRTPAQGPRKPCGCLESDGCLHGIMDDGLARTGGPDDGYRGQPRTPVPDVTCSHGLALDVHCCACGRSGFFPPEDCTCTFDTPEAIAGGDPAAPLASRPDERGAGPAPGATVSLWPEPWPPFTYLAGAAGSGKTFAMKDAAARMKGLLLCATTGIAAINLGGTTVNAMLGYFDTKSLQESWTTGFLAARIGKLWRAGVRRLVLDEVSMLDGDQLTYLVTAIEEVNGRGYVLDANAKARRQRALGSALDEDEPESLPGEEEDFGLSLVGDFCQLAPVKAPYAFESAEWDRFEPNIVTLTEIRRQADPAFIDALRAARRGDGRRALEFFGPTLQTETDDRFEGPTLLAKNDSVDRYNWLRLSRLDGRQVIFPSSREGKQRAEWGNLDKPPATWGIPQRLNLKIGALVMILANRRFPMSTAFEYVNGDLGTIVDADEEHKIAYVTLQRTGQTVAVDYVRREMTIPMDSARRKELIALGQTDKISGWPDLSRAKWEIVGWISYMPLRVAYASTVHKSQGLSLDRVQVNIRDAFFKSSGMLYVALSRARTAAGLRLVGSSAAFIERCTVDPRLKAWL